MEGQFPLVQVLEHSQGHPAHGPFSYPGKYRIPKLIEQGGAKAQRAVGHHKDHRDPKQHVRAAVLVEVVDDVFQGNGRGNGRQLGQHQQNQGQDYPAAEFGEIGPEA